jgi:hypothetical protein
MKGLEGSTAQQVAFIVWRQGVASNCHPLHGIITVNLFFVGVNFEFLKRKIFLKKL